MADARVGGYKPWDMARLKGPELAAIIDYARQLEGGDDDGF